MLKPREESHKTNRSRSSRTASQGTFGLTPHALLPKIPPTRISKVTAKRIAELNRKFGTPGASMYSEKEPTKSGFIASPLGYQVLEKMSDRALLKLVASGKLGHTGGSGRWRWKGDHIEEASIDTIASDFRVAAQRKPERFGRLVTRWPVDGHFAFLKAILSGLAFPGDRRQEPGLDTWKPPSQELLVEILSTPVVQALARHADDIQVADNLCDLLQRYAEYPWTAAAVEFVLWVAQHHNHPPPGYFPAGAVDDESDHFDRLESNALNVTRGSAAYAIRSLLFHHPELFESLRPAIECLIRDPHPALRVAALAACLPVINIDKDLAVRWFLEAVEGPEQVLATNAVAEFLRHSYRTHLSQLLPTLDRMAASQLPKVAAAGARWIAAAFLVAREAEDRFERCIAGTSEQRMGVAEVAAVLVGEGEYAENAKTTLLRLSDDADEKVAQVVARSFRHLDLRHITADSRTWNRFARSRAFQADPTPLLLALEEQSGNLLPFAECLLAAGTTFAEELAEAARDHTRDFAGDAAHYLLPLLLRLYEQAKGHEQTTYHSCLDLWDRLLERRVGSAMGLSRELDRI